MDFGILGKNHTDSVFEWRRSMQDASDKLSSYARRGLFIHVLQESCVICQRGSCLIIKLKYFF